MVCPPSLLYILWLNPALTDFRGFVWRVAAIAAVSLVPPYLGKIISRTMKPPSYRKVQST